MPTPGAVDSQNCAQPQPQLQAQRHLSIAGGEAEHVPCAAGCRAGAVQAAVQVAALIIPHALPHLATCSRACPAVWPELCCVLPMIEPVLIAIAAGRLPIDLAEAVKQRILEPLVGCGEDCSTIAGHVVPLGRQAAAAAASAAASAAAAAQDGCPGWLRVSMDLQLPGNDCMPDADGRAEQGSCSELSSRLMRNPGWVCGARGSDRENTGTRAPLACLARKGMTLAPEVSGQGEARFLQGGRGTLLMRQLVRWRRRHGRGGAATCQACPPAAHPPAGTWWLGRPPG